MNAEIDTLQDHVNELEDLILSGMHISLVVTLDFKRNNTKHENHLTSLLNHKT